MFESGRWRRWVPGVLIVALGLIEPLTHLWIQFAPSAGSVPTGLRTGDSGHHLIAMESFANGFYSPFVTCAAESPHGFAWFSVPIFLLYGVVGEIGRLLGISPFFFLGLANGLGGALLLWAVYRFLRRIAPTEAPLAFVLYCAGGGVGGLVFIGAWLAGATDLPEFEGWFMRFAQYGLIEGQTLAPWLLFPRLYYTLPMALGFAGLTALVETDRCRCAAHLTFACFLLFLASLINIRLAPMFWAVGVLYLMLGSAQAGRFRGAMAGATMGASALGALASLLILRGHPTYQENVASVARECALLLPLLYGCLFLLPPAVAALPDARRSLPRGARALADGLVAALVVYAALYLGHQIWFGNFWRGGDQAAAMAASTPALIALPVAAVWRARRGDANARNDAPQWTGWVALWLLGLTVVSLSAAFDGWLLQFAPQRGMVLMGVPLALLAAHGLGRMPRPVARAVLTLILAGGGASLLVAGFYFQGPMSRTPGRGPFAYLHYEHMTEADGRLLQTLPPGTVLVPPWSPIAFGEIVAHHGDHQVIGGPGAMNLGDQPFGPLQASVNRFFTSETTGEDRQALVAQWCVDYLYCPDTCPVGEPLMEAFRGTPWLELIVEDGRGAVFRVIARDD